MRWKKRTFIESCCRKVKRLPAFKLFRPFMMRRLLESLGLRIWAFFVSLWFFSHDLGFLNNLGSNFWKLKCFRATCPWVYQKRKVQYSSCLWKRNATAMLLFIILLASVGKSYFYLPVFCPQNSILSVDQNLMKTECLHASSCVSGLQEWIIDELS